MTNEEAIVYLKSTIGVQQVYKGNDAIGARYGSCYGHEDEINLAIQALERQIPQEPFETYDDDTCIYKHFECPNCGERRSRHASLVYCMNCGQALDWSKDD